MLISRKKSFLFIHIQKTAGNSIRRALEDAIPDVDDFLGTHDPASAARRYLGAEAYQSFFTAAFVRNPWDRLVSWYTMIRQGGSKPWPWSRPIIEPEPRLWRYVQETSSSFDEFVHRCTAEIDDVDGTKSFCWNQVDYLSDESGRLIVDFIGRYENLAADTARLFERLAVDPPRVPHLNPSKHRHYSAYYSAETAEVVRARFRRDIEAFGYEFVPRDPPGSARAPRKWLRR
jgi:hypothetical protein